LGNRESTNNIPTEKQYPKLSKALSGYFEIEHFKNADLHTGYFCYNCTYFIKPNHCAIVEDSGPDVYNKESGVIALYGLCTLWDLMRMRHVNKRRSRSNGVAGVVN